MSVAGTASTRAQIGRGLARVLLLGALVIAGLAVRAWSSASDELGRAEVARTGGDLESAIDHYRRASVWDFPGNVRARAALEALLDVGHDAETRGDATLALAAFRAVHGSIMSSRHLWVPHADLLRAADEEIATLMASGTVPPIDAHRSPEERRAAYLALLEQDRDVSTGAALLALLGFVVWVSGAALGLGRGFDERGEIVVREARRWGLLVVVGFGLFVVGLALG